MSELELAYWREDPLLNDHHEHWHLVYPYNGGRSDTPTWLARHGELFAYMHAQMLARYDAERHALGLDPVQPLSDYTEPIDEGYSPGTALIRSNGALVPVSGRAAGAVMSDIKTRTFACRPGARLSDQVEFRKRLLAAAQSSVWGPGGAVDINSLAERTEPTDRGIDPFYGALHNDGHLHLALIDGDETRPGFMFYEAAAICDPVFYRWHRDIDNIFRELRSRLEPHAFDKGPPLTIEDLAVAHLDGEANNLWTETRERPLAGPGPTRSIPYRSQPDFTYSITVRSDETVDVTLRVFMVPEGFCTDYAAWIEMDKFWVQLHRGSNTVSRASDESSVVRHPVLKPDCLEHGIGCPTAPDGSGVACRCGWPYTLLLPRGREDGLPCRFMVMASPGSDLGGHHDRPAGTSYCGLLDSEYPDQRPMGYPFDRPFSESIDETMNAVPQMAQTADTLRHRTGM
jgi:tyrosinase